MFTFGRNPGSFSKFHLKIEFKPKKVIKEYVNIVETCI